MHCYKTSVRVKRKVVTEYKYESFTELLQDRGTSQFDSCYRVEVRVTGVVVTRLMYESWMKLLQAISTSQIQCCYTI
jgi:hypothetical protein